MKSDAKEALRSLEPAIRRGRIEQLTIYEISESELEKLQEGSPASLHLNFAVALLSTGISLIVALCTTTIESMRVYLTFVVVTAISAIIGVVLFAIWLRAHLSKTSLADRIRLRAPPEGVLADGVLPPLLPPARSSPNKPPDSSTPE